MQRSDGRSDTDANTAANGAESATENKLEDIHLGEGRSHDGKFLKDFGEVLGNLSYLDSEEDSDEDELATFVAFIGITEFVEGETDTDDDQSSADGVDEIDYQELCQTVVQIVLEKQVKNEKARSSDLNAKLEHHYKTVRMLTGSKEFDKILSLGRQDQTSRGLRYTGYRKSDTEPNKFVPSSNSEGRTTSEGTTSKHVAEKVKNLQKVLRLETQQERGCYYCRKPGHIKKKCYHYREKVNQLLRQEKYWRNGSRNQVWIRKSDLGHTTVKSTQRPIHRDASTAANGAESAIEK
ncbi:hypothetical protein DY000_02059594 [Brassica cretica]|uniref:CCHC-type domain-containing protein n=1 Tax=Brassica cretica TaxID=69181 RepID=A0ABQ7AS78_BRACR|nr:hypothetical protein DY000_02059594 [Brassica cretica]